MSSAPRTGVIGRRAADPEVIRDFVSLDADFALSSHPVAQVAQIMRCHHLYSLPVCDAAGTLSGEVAYEDLRDLLRVPEVASMTIGDSGFVHAPGLVVDLDEAADGLRERMAGLHSWTASVTHGRTFVGVVRYRDLVNASQDVPSVQSCDEPALWQ